MAYYGKCVLHETRAARNRLLKHSTMQEDNVEYR